MIKKSNYQNIDLRESILGEYLQSYLYWLYNQNHEFIDVFSVDEVVNYLNTIKKPTSIELILKTERQKWIIFIYEFIKSYKKESSSFSETFSINSKLNLDFSFVNEKSNIIEATQKQKDFVISLLKRKGIEIKQNEFIRMSKNEASMLINLLK